MNHFYEGETYKIRNLHANRWNVPDINIITNTNEFIIEMAAPGYDKEQFQIELVKNDLKILEETNHEESENQVNYSRKEFQYDSFDRNFTLPDIANSEKIAAKYEVGILRITVPKMLLNKKFSEK